MVTEVEGRGRENWRTVVQRAKPPLIRQISTRDEMYNMINIINTVVFIYESC